MGSKYSGSLENLGHRNIIFALTCREANNIKVFGQRNSQTQNEVVWTPKHSSHCNDVAVHKGGCTSPLWIQQAAILVETWVELKEGTKKMVCMYICIYVCIYSYLLTYLPKQDLPHLGNDRPLISPALWLTVSVNEETFADLYCFTSFYLRIWERE